MKRGILRKTFFVGGIAGVTLFTLIILDIIPLEPSFHSPLSQRYMEKCNTLFNEEAKDTLYRDSIRGPFYFTINKDSFKALTADYSLHCKIFFGVSDSNNFQYYFRTVDPDDGFEGPYCKWDSVKNRFVQVQEDSAVIDICKYRTDALPDLDKFKPNSSDHNTKSLFINKNDMQNYHNVISEVISNRNSSRSRRDTFKSIQINLTQLAEVGSKDDLSRSTRWKINGSMIHRKPFKDHLSLFFTPIDNKGKIIKSGSQNYITYDVNNICPPKCKFN